MSSEEKLEDGSTCLFFLRGNTKRPLTKWCGQIAQQSTTRLQEPGFTNSPCLARLYILRPARLYLRRQNSRVHTKVEEMLSVTGSSTLSFAEEQEDTEPSKVEVC